MNRSTPRSAARKKTMDALRTTALSASIALLCACTPESARQVPAFDGRRAYAEVEALVQISPRDAGTPGGRHAAEHLAERLKAFNIDTQIDTFTDSTPEGVKTFHNVIGRIPGKTDRWIILGSHFDTMPGIDNFEGANDSGSSTGVLLELGRIFAETQPHIGIQLAFFDGEEGIAHYIPGDGLHGSRHMARAILKAGAVKKYEAMLLMDMIGDADLNYTVPQNSDPQLLREIFTAAKALGLRDRFTLANHGVTDDHVPFMEVGIPAFDLIDFKYGSAPGLNDYWHTEADRMEHISAESLQITGDLVAYWLKKRAWENEKGPN